MERLCTRPLIVEMYLLAHFAFVRIQFIVSFANLLIKRSPCSLLLLLSPHLFIRDAVDGGGRLYVARYQRVDRLSVDFAVG